MERCPYRDLEIHHLLRKGAHLVVEAEAVLALVVGREDEVTLSLFGAVQDYPVAGAGNCVVDVEGAARLYLRKPLAGFLPEDSGSRTAK